MNLTRMSRNQSKRDINVRPFSESNPPRPSAAASKRLDIRPSASHDPDGMGSRPVNSYRECNGRLPPAFSALLPLDSLKTWSALLVLLVWKMPSALPCVEAVDA